MLKYDPKLARKFYNYSEENQKYYKNNLRGLWYTIFKLLIIPQKRATLPQISPINAEPFTHIHPPIIPTAKLIPDSQYRTNQIKHLPVVPEQTTACATGSHPSNRYSLFLVPGRPNQIYINSYTDRQQPPRWPSRRPSGPDSCLGREIKFRQLLRRSWPWEKLLPF